VSRPKFKRRKEARPGEIVSAALEIFTEKGFAAARLDDIAARAGVSKGALYLYFDTKEALFHAVVTEAVAPNVARVRNMIEAYEGSFADFLPAFAAAFAQIAQRTAIGAIVKMVVAESRNFPRLASDWHDEVVAPMIGTLTALIAKAQAGGEVRAGDPRIYALQLAAPFMLGVLWRETFVPAGAPAFDLEAVADQHARTLARGLAAETQP
jgi:AcrR family transcriptional regulator